MSYVDGFLVPVNEERKDDYQSVAERMAPLFLEYGATRVVESYEDDHKEGKNNDFHTALLTENGEKAVFSWIEWPSKQVRDEAWEKLMQDDRMNPGDTMPFDGSRMIYGGFAVMLDERGDD